MKNERIMIPILIFRMKIIFLMMLKKMNKNPNRKKSFTANGTRTSQSVGTNSNAAVSGWMKPARRITNSTNVR